MQKLRYFSDAEIAKVTHPAAGDERKDPKSFYSPKLLQMLDSMRYHAGCAIPLSSGYRCESYNAQVGGSPTSSHLKGLAMDIRVPENDSYLRYHYLRAAIASGFTRIGLGKGFMHLDVDDSKSCEVIWIY